MRFLQISKTSLFLSLGVLLVSNLGFADSKKKEVKKDVKTEVKKDEGGCEFKIFGNDSMMFVDGEQATAKKVDEITIPASCKSFKVLLKHSGKLAKEVMGHNWILTESKNMDAVIAEAMKLAPSYTPPAKDKVLAASKTLLGGGGAETIEFSTSVLKKGGDYSFFCAFPGHFGLMRGKVKF